jgi:putative flippase GtrA
MPRSEIWVRMNENPWRAHQKLRFLVVGVWNTAFAYLVYGVLYAVLHTRVHYLGISCLAHLLAAANAFVCQRKIVFESTTPWWPAFVRFNVVQGLILMMSLAGIAFLVEVIKVRPLISQIVVMTAAVIASYLLNLKFSFRKYG